MDGIDDVCEDSSLLSLNFDNSEIERYASGWECVGGSAGQCRH